MVFKKYLDEFLMRQMSTFDTVGSDQFVSGPDPAVRNGRFLDQGLDGVPQQGRIVSLAEQGEAKAAVDLAEDDGELAVVVVQVGVQVVLVENVKKRSFLVNDAAE